MRYNEISPPKTHPYICSIIVDPADLARLQDMADERPELRFLDYDDSEPDHWTVRIGCASRTVAARLADAWD